MVVSPGRGGGQKGSAKGVGNCSGTFYGVSLFTDGGEVGEHGGDLVGGGGTGRSRDRGWGEVAGEGDHDKIPGLDGF